MELLYIGLLIGVLSGAALGFFAAAWRTSTIYARRLSEVEAKLADSNATQAASAAIAEELRRTLDARSGECETLRQNLLKEERGRAEAETRLEDAGEAMVKERALIDAMEEKLKERFGVLSLEALTRNSEEFLKLAAKSLSAQTDMGAKELEGKKELIDQSVEGMARRMADMQKRIEELSAEGSRRMVEVSGEVKKHAEATLKLSETTEHLRRTLASSRKRGEWGERMAEDIIKLVGMIEGINYIKQKTLDTARTRPDYTFLLPNEMRINMDVKFPMDHYVHYLEATTDIDKRHHREELIKSARVMIRDVTGREYIDADTVDYVLVFIPNEQVYGFLNESAPQLMDEALSKKVILCSPFTLYAVLAVVRQAVSNFSLERTASEILRLLGDFNKQWTAYKDRFEILGKRIDEARREYENISSTRTNMLERPMRKIELLRESTPMSEAAAPAKDLLES